jgi:CHAT domain-containing protein
MLSLINYGYSVAQISEISLDSQIYYLNRPSGFHQEHNYSYESRLLDSAIYFNFKGNDNQTIFYCQKIITAGKANQNLNFSLSYLLGLSYFYSHNTQLAKTNFLMAINTIPNNSTVDSTLIYCAHIYELLSSCYIKTDNIDSGEYYINKALTLYNPISPRKMSNLYFNLSLIHNEKNDKQEKNTLIKYINISEDYKLENKNEYNYTNVLERLSLIYYQDNLSDSSIYYLNEIINTYQKGLMEDSLRIPYIYYDLSIVYKNVDSILYKDALINCKLTCEKYNYYQTDIYNLVIELLGVQLDKENNFDEAEKYYKYSIELQKKYPKSTNQFGAFYNLVNLYINHHNFEGVEALTVEINNLKYDSLKIKLYLRLADAYKGIGLLEKAIDYYNLYLPFATVQDSISYLNLLGNLYFKKGAYNLAKEEYKKSLSLNSDSTNQLFYEIILHIIDIDIIQNNLIDVNNNLKLVINNYKIINNSYLAALKISTTYSLLGNENEAIKWLKISEELNSYDNYISTYIKACNYHFENDFSNSNKYFIQYIKGKPKYDNESMSQVFLIIAINYYYLLQFDSSFKYLEYFFNEDINYLNSRIKVRDEKSNIEHISNSETYNKYLIPLISDISRNKINNKQRILNSYYKFILHTKQIILKNHHLLSAKNSVVLKLNPNEYNLNNLLKNQNNFNAIEIISHYNELNYDSIAYDFLMLNSKDTNVKIFSIPKGNIEINSMYQIISDSNKINSMYNNVITNPCASNNLINLLDSKCQINNNVFISLSGEFHFINIPCLHINKDSILADKYKIHILGSTADIVNYTPTYLNLKSIKEVNSFGDIDYNKSNSTSTASLIENNIGYPHIAEIATRSGTSKFGYLPGTKKEIEDIANLCDKNKIPVVSYEGQNASEDNFKKLNGQHEPYVLHIATHGYFFPDPIKTNPTASELLQNKKNKYKLSDDPLLRSGLILSGANATWGKTDYFTNTTEDGILTGYEIANTDLSGCQLVVLSACETGLGDINASEGVFGLQRAFKMAGVKNVIMSLWTVPDNETPKLMNLFYNNCFKGESVHDALQHAQNEMKANGYPPYYWAGFKLLE